MIEQCLCDCNKVVCSSSSHDIPVDSLGILHFFWCNIFGIIYNIYKIDDKNDRELHNAKPATSSLYQASRISFYSKQCNEMSPNRPDLCRTTAVKIIELLVK